MALSTLRAWRVLRARPRLWTSVTLGLLVGLLLPRSLVAHATTRALLGWNACMLLYLGLALQMMWTSDVPRLRRRAQHESEGRILVLVLVVLASVAVLLAIGSQLAAVKDLHGIDKTRHVALAALTLVNAWLFTQTLFALHYAHDFHAARVRGQADVMQFPGTEHPDYGDFVYFACVIGTSAQTADVAVSSQAMRRVVMVHCVQAFFFNTTVLAMTINIAASLF